jgi:hypothetical protein
MKSLLFLPLLISLNTVFCQTVINVDKAPINQPFYLVRGNPVNIAKYVKITAGSPYFSEEWMKATVKITDTTLARNVMVRLDLLDGNLEFKNEKNEQMICTMPVSSVEIFDSITGKNYFFVPSSRIANSSNRTWYQTLFGGAKITLFKELHKDIFESKPYGSSLTEQEIRTSERYFIWADNNITRVKKFSDILELAGNRLEALKKYIDTNNLSVKKELDIIALIEYYNSLN